MYEKMLLKYLYNGQTRATKLPDSIPYAQGTALKSAPERRHALLKCDLYTIHNIKDSIVYLWLIDGSEFWYYIVSCQEESLSGYIKGSENWVYRQINLKKVEAYY